jgi:hypothetical protein
MCHFIVCLALLSPVCLVVHPCIISLYLQCYCHLPNNKPIKLCLLYSIVYFYKVDLDRLFFNVFIIYRYCEMYAEKSALTFVSKFAAVATGSVNPS